MWVRWAKARLLERTARVARAQRKLLQFRKNLLELRENIGAELVPLQIAQQHQRHLARQERALRELEHLVVGDLVDLARQFVARDIAVEVDLVARQAVHPPRGPRLAGTQLALTLP